MEEGDRRVITILDGAQAVRLFPQIEALIAPVLAVDGLYLPVDVLMHHLRAEMQIWASVLLPAGEVEMVVVSQIMRFPRRALFACPYVAGRNLVANGKPFMAELEKFARSRGCTRIAGGFRRGWVRLFDFEEHGCLLWKDLA